MSIIRRRRGDAATAGFTFTATALAASRGIPAEPAVFQV
jgi:hypothetical protein